MSKDNDAILMEQVMQKLEEGWLDRQKARLNSLKQGTGAAVSNVGKTIRAGAADALMGSSVGDPLRAQRQDVGAIRNQAKIDSLSKAHFNKILAITDRLGDAFNNMMEDVKLTLGPSYDYSKLTELGKNIGFIRNNIITNLRNFNAGELDKQTDAGPKPVEPAPEGVESYVDPIEERQPVEDGPDTGDNVNDTRQPDRTSKEPRMAFSDEELSVLDKRGYRWARLRQLLNKGKTPEEILELSKTQAPHTIKV